MVLGLRKRTWRKPNELPNDQDGGSCVAIRRCENVRGAVLRERMERKRLSEVIIRWLKRLGMFPILLLFHGRVSFWQSTLCI